MKTPGTMDYYFNTYTRWGRMNLFYITMGAWTSLYFYVKVNGARKREKKAAKDRKNGILYDWEIERNELKALSGKPQEMATYLQKKENKSKEYSQRDRDIWAIKIREGWAGPNPDPECPCVSYFDRHRIYYQAFMNRHRGMRDSRFNLWVENHLNEGIHDRTDNTGDLAVAVVQHRKAMDWFWGSTSKAPDHH